MDHPPLLRHLLAKIPPDFGFLDKVCGCFHAQNEEYIDLLAYLPALLKTVYPEALAFLAKLLESQPVVRKEREKKKNRKKRDKQTGPEDAVPMLDLPQLFEFFRKEKAYASILGDPSQLDSFDQLLKIVLRLPGL